MNESKWLSGWDGEAMVDFVAERLSPRQWVQLAAAHVRRLWDLLPEGVLQQAVDAAEPAEAPLGEAARDEWSQRITDAIPGAVEAGNDVARIDGLCGLTEDAGPDPVAVVEIRLEVVHPQAALLERAPLGDEVAHPFLSQVAHQQADGGREDPEQPPGAIARGSGVQRDGRLRCVVRSDHTTGVGAGEAEG